MFNDFDFNVFGFWSFKALAIPVIWRFRSRAFALSPWRAAAATPPWREGWHERIGRRATRCAAQQVLDTWRLGLEGEDMKFQKPGSDLQ